MIFYYNFNFNFITEVSYFIIEISICRQQNYQKFRLKTPIKKTTLKKKDK